MPAGLREVAPEARPPAHPPAVPVNWYMLAGSAELRPGRIITRSIAGREIVLTRFAEGGVRAFAARCAHMGCHLRHGRAEAAGLRCALHHRLIAPDGAFVGPDGRPSARLTQPSLPVREHLGGVFVWLGPAGAETELPLPEIATQGPVMSRYVGRFDFAVPWYGLIANGFDMEHLASVHRRALREPPVIDTSVPGRFALSYRSRVIGGAPSDRLMKWLSGDSIRATMTSVNGSMMLVQSAVARPSFGLLSMLPDGRGGTQVQALFGAEGNARHPLDALRLSVTSWLFKRFFASDMAIFADLGWHPPAHRLAPADGWTQALYAFFCAQPEALPEGGPHE